MRAPVSAMYEEVIDAAPSEIFRAWTEPAQLKQWFGPGGFQTIEADVDLRVGGAYRIVMRTPDGAKLVITGTYHEIRPAERLVYTWAWAHVAEDEMRVTVELHPVGRDRTRVVITHADIVDGELGRYESGWREGIARLRALLKK